MAMKTEYISPNGVRFFLMAQTPAELVKQAAEFAQNNDGPAHLLALALADALRRIEALEQRLKSFDGFNP